LSAPGDLYVSDYGGDILRFTPDGTERVFATGLGTIYGLAFDSSGNLFAASQSTGNIYEFAPDGTQRTFASGIGGLQGLAFDGAGHLFASGDDSSGAVILKFAEDGTYTTFDTQMRTSIHSLVCDKSGDLFAAEQPSPAIYIYEYSPNGLRTRYSPSSLGDATTGSGLAFDSAGNLFVGSGGGYISEIAKDGTRTIFYNNTTSASTHLGLAFDENGDLFAADSIQNSIEECTADGATNVFVTGINTPEALAFEPVVPEPSLVSILALGGVLLAWRWKAHAGEGRNN